MTVSASNADALSIAVEASNQAAQLLQARVDEARSVEQSKAHDVKLLGDKLAEATIIEVLKARSDFAILSEEMGGDDPSGAGNIWIVDPLDGSLNYSRGIPNCCISIALWRDAAPVLGVVYDFYRNDLYTGIVGEGAWLNESPIETSNTSATKDAILCTGFPVNTDFSSEAIGQFIASIQQYKKIRLLGSAALSLAYLASGKIDGYREDTIMVWDVAAGIALVQAAGGNVRFGEGSITNSLDVIATCHSLTIED